MDNKWGIFLAQGCRAGPRARSLLGTLLHPELYVGQKVPCGSWEEQRPGPEEGMPVAGHSWSQTALGILRMSPVPGPLVWEVIKGLQWETPLQAPPSWLCSHRYLSQSCDFLRQHGFGAEGVRRAHSVIHGPQGMAAFSAMSFLCCLSASCL